LPSADASEPPEDTPEGPGLELTSLDFSQIVRDSVAQASIASPAVVVEVSTPPTLPAVGEAEALGGVVRMLVDNACRRSDAGVTVKAKRGDEGITVHVIDRGAGMDREHAPEGFAQAKTLVALHGGILWAEPLPGGGTKVAFTIPEQPPDLEGQDLEEATEALRLLGQLAAAPSAGSAQQVGTGDTVDLTEGDPESAGPLDLAAMVELAAAEATIPIEEPPTEESGPPQVVEPPVGLEDLWPDTADEPAESSEVTGPIDAIVPQFVDAEVQDSGRPAVEPPQTEADMVAELGVPEPAEVPEISNVADAPGPEPAATEPVEDRTVADIRPEPVSGRGVEDRRAQAVEPAKRFVLDPLHPATQLLRGMALDYDPDADDLPSSSLGRRGRTT
jgi:Histidine kinase-, DNA gyrase B-, and HSP90-like ATPase